MDHATKLESAQLRWRFDASELTFNTTDNDQDFSDLLKVLANFDSETKRNAVGVGKHAGVIAKLCETEGLPPFSGDGQFHIYAVKTISQALEVLTEKPVGDPLSVEDYAPGSLFDLAQVQAYDFFKKSMGSKEEEA